MIALLAAMLPGTLGIVLASIAHGVYGKKIGAFLAAGVGIAISIAAIVVVGWVWPD